MANVRRIGSAVAIDNPSLDLPCAYRNVFEGSKLTISIPPIKRALEDLPSDLQLPTDIIEWLEEEYQLRHKDHKDYTKQLNNVQSLNSYTLYDFQVSGINYILNMVTDDNLRMLLADDPRLGKSIQALTTLKILKPNGGILILCLKSLIPQWIEYVHEWLPEYSKNIFVVSGTKNKKLKTITTAFETKNPIIITNWETIRQDLGTLKSTTWWAIVGDEAQKIKNRKSQLTLSVQKLKSKHLLLLSATFTESSSIDWWVYLNLLFPKQFTSYWRFAGWYTNIEIGYWGVNVTGSKNTKYLIDHIKPYVLRRRITDIGTNIPEVIEQTVYSEMTSKQSQLYTRVKKEIILELEEEKELDIPNIAARIVRLRQAALHPYLIERTLKRNLIGKFETLHDLLKFTIPLKEQVIVYCTFIDGCLLGSELIDNSKIYAGSFEDENTIKDFKENKFRVLFTTPQKGGVGLNLYNANYIIYIDLPWSSILLRQSKSRVIAINKKDPIGIYTLIIKDSIDEYVYKVLTEKLTTLTKAEILTNLVGFLKESMV